MASTDQEGLIFASTPRLSIVVGITGGIAAYKAVGVVRSLVLAGHDVHVVATEAALRFVGRPTLEAISRNLVNTDLYEGVAQVRHVSIGQSADLIIIAPATANTIAKLAVGLADDLLGTTILASTAPLVIAPAMHTEMWTNPATVHNIATLRSRGVTIVGPGDGKLTGSDSGAGRMSEVDEIVSAALAVVNRLYVDASHINSSRVNSSQTNGFNVPLARVPSSDGTSAASAEIEQDLRGKRIVITAGGTREAIDPVRFIGNRSSGKQGVALARAAALRGAIVTLIGANLEVPAPDGVHLVQLGSAAELQEAVMTAARSSDVVIMAAAVADYRPESLAEGKIKKEAQGERLTLRLVKNPDILASLSAQSEPGQIVIGFAAETESDRESLLALGRAKVARKGCDYLVVNRVGWSEGFAADTNAVIVLNNAGDIVMESSGRKIVVAERILDLLVTPAE